MAIAFDNHSFTENKTSSATVPHTIAGSNNILFIGVGNQNTTAPGLVQYAGVDASLITSLQGSNSRTIWVYYLVAPIAGTNNIQVNITSGTYTFGGLSYTGASQSSIPDAFNTATNASAAALTASVTTIADNCWTMMTVIGSGSGGLVTAGTNFNIHDTVDANLGMGDSAAAKTPAGSISMTANFGATQGLAGIIISFAPFVAPPGNGKFFSVF